MKHQNNLSPYYCLHQGGFPGHSRDATEWLILPKRANFMKSSITTLRIEFSDVSEIQLSCLQFYVIKDTLNRVIPLCLT